MASGRWSGSARRTNKLHQLKISATLPASNRQRLRSCVVKPPHPHWFFNSSNVFSQSARSRYNWPSVRISLSSEVTNAALFPDLPIRPDLGEAEPRLSRVAVIDDRQRTFQLAPQQNDPPLPAPTFQPQTGLLAVPALAGIRPVRLGHRPLQCPADILRRPQAEQISQIALLGLCHYRLDTPGEVTAQQPRPTVTVPTVQHRPQTAPAILDVLLVAGL